MTTTEVWKEYVFFEVEISVFYRSSDFHRLTRGLKMHVIVFEYELIFENCQVKQQRIMINDESLSAMF